MLSLGNCFGEEEVLSGHETRTNMVTCVSAIGECYVINKKDFI